VADPGTRSADDQFTVWVSAWRSDRDGSRCGATPATGINPVVCGDSHLGNFGFYASPEGELVIDLNDFDEAHPGAWNGTCADWLPASGSLVRENGRSEDECRASVLACVAAYRAEVRFLAEQPLLLRSFNRLGRRPAP
jgi:uncharacterized protein (DUF2252 family)